MSLRVRLSQGSRKVFVQRDAVRSFGLQRRNEGSFVALEITPLSPLCQSEKMVREGSSRDSPGAGEIVHFFCLAWAFFVSSLPS